MMSEASCWSTAAVHALEHARSCVVRALLHQVVVCVCTCGLSVACYYASWVCLSPGQSLHAT